MLPEMRLSTTAWFATGCGLALVLLTGGIAGALGGPWVVDAVRGQASSASTEVTSEGSSLLSMTPAVDAASEHAVMPPVSGSSWSDVPVQRPLELRDSPPVAPPPPLPFQDVDENVGVQWHPGEARLPSIEATEHWNPDDARIPDGSAVVATRAYWNPNSAVLPRASRFTPATWNPDDARLPSS